MASSFKTSRLLSAVAISALAIVSPAQAQWLPPFGATSPSEIVQRLQAEGYVLIGPLRRNDTVYLADVRAHGAGRERLVIDAWSGEILQRLVARPASSGLRGANGYVSEGGEFDGPPPLSPPPARDFFSGPGGSGNYAYGESPDVRNPGESVPRPRIRSKPAATARRPSETANAPAASKPPEAGGNGPAKDNAGAPPPAVAAPTGGSVAAPEAPKEASAPAKTEGSSMGTGSPASSEPSKILAPKNDNQGASPAGSQAKNAPQPSGARPASPVRAPAEKPGDKSKVNDVPVNPLE
jgi:hypothetical protein